MIIRINLINTFCLSTTDHDFAVWIITSYYYDKAFKIFNHQGDCLQIVKNEDYIISLQGLLFTPANTYICVRSPKSINLFINEHFIRQIELPDEKEIDPYINFKIIASSNFLEENKFIIILSIKRDLSSYFIKIVNISQVFPLYIKLNEVFFLFRF